MVIGTAGLVVVALHTSVATNARSAGRIFYRSQQVADVPDRNCFLLVNNSTTAHGPCKAQEIFIV